MSTNLKKLTLVSLGAIFLVFLIDNSAPPSYERVNSESSFVNGQNSAVAEKPATRPAPEKVSDAKESAGTKLYSVAKVIDGDTLVVAIDGTNETIRLIGINTPETVDPRKTVGCFGKEASDKAKEMLLGQNVRVERDPSKGERDKYGRLLAYVFLPHDLNFNRYMIAEGYAYEYTYDTPYKHQQSFKEAQRDAERLKKGLWADGACAQENAAWAPITTPTPRTQTTSPDTICSYNAYNCSDFSTHDGAQATFEACGGISNDIHRLDQDADGQACESLP